MWVCQEASRQSLGERDHVRAVLSGCCYALRSLAKVKLGLAAIEMVGKILEF